MQHLAKIPFPDVERIARTGRALVILPVGVVENTRAPAAGTPIRLPPRYTQKPLRPIWRRKAMKSS